ncbi:nucleotidyltransferase [Planococcus sp. X10-3]|uniref:nucleotidyltransferase n=1 Tax=Planococcus sp. X10-3 TaxID=3061240 RepID=UPI003BB1CC0F
MKAAGIVVEYNPFHNGHLHHARSAKESSGADILIAVMSGQFLQRGEPAFADKWKRTEMALANGVDLVIELPYVYATAQASDFARGAITLLDAIGCESFCFGSEQGNIDPFLKSRHLLNKENLFYQQKIHEAVQSGISYPKALNAAYHAVTAGEEGFADLSKPNNILGYHYIEAADRISSPMRPLTIQRIGANYHDPITEGMSIASATGIRNAFFEGGSIDELSTYMPAPSLQGLQSFAHEYGRFGSWEAFYPLLRYTILKDRPATLRRFAEVTEGIENLIYEAARKEQDFESFIALVKSKRFTRTRIQRMLTHIYTGFTWEQLKSFDQPSYLRLLGMTNAGRQYLHAQKKNIKLPIISRAADLADGMGKLDIHASSLYMLGLGAKNLKKEFTTPPIYFG